MYKYESGALSRGLPSAWCSVRLRIRPEGIKSDLCCEDKTDSHPGSPPQSGHRGGLVRNFDLRTCEEKALLPHQAVLDKNYMD